MRRSASTAPEFGMNVNALLLIGSIRLLASPSIVVMRNQQVRRQTLALGTQFLCGSVNALAVSFARLVSEDWSQRRDDGHESGSNEATDHCLDVFVGCRRFFVEQVALFADHPATQRRLHQFVIDEIEMGDTPQTATWYLCLEATVDGVKKRHFLPDKGYEKNKLTIPIGMEFPKASAGQKCSFRLQLDDIEEDTCGDEPDQRSMGEFTASERGSQVYKPEANWSYTIRWHLK
jgi:hypothetical protein